MTRGSICRNSPSVQEGLHGVELLYAEGNSGSSRIFFFFNLGDSYYNSVDWAYNNRSKYIIQYYVTVNIIQFKLLSVLTHHQIPLRYTLGVPQFFHIAHQMHPDAEQK